MTSYIVGKKIRAMGSGPLELFPFVVLAIKFCIFIAPACSRVRYRRPIFCPSVRPSVSVCPSVNIYVDVRHLCQSKYSNQLQD